MTITLERPARFLLLSNAATIAIALFEGWNVSEVMWIYWAQSVVIGCFNVPRLLRLGEFPAEGEGMNGRPVSPSVASKWFGAIFFAFHYGFFHFVYFFLLSSAHPLPGSSDLLSMGACVAVFAVNHAISYRENVGEDLRRRRDVGAVMMFPYKRIMPMHLTLIFGSLFASGSPWTLLLFLSLKTGADLSMHLVEHGKLSAADEGGVTERERENPRPGG